MPFEDGSAPAIGFYTTRDVHASNVDDAANKAADLVLEHWLPGGSYAAVNQGAVPTLTLDRSWRVRFFQGLFARKSSGYVFYPKE